ncbi:MAG: MBL fold metallo-hydrolase [Clostridia bacterium]|nr:MBL fold metallo-hydrolase [Clostridia bacterium]
MAKKSSKTTKSKKQTASPVEKAAKKAYKANPKAFIISIVAIVLVIAIATAVVYFAFPDTWDSIVATIKGDNNNNGGGSTNLVGGDGELAVHIINVGQGDCIYIKFPDGKDMVIDSGCTTKPYDSFGKNVVLNYLQDHVEGDLEYLMLTHTDTDHVSYLDEVVDAFDVNNIFMPNVLSTPNMSKWSEKDKNRFNSIPQEKKDMFTDEDTISTEQYASFFAAALTEPNCNIYINMDDDDNTNNIVIRDDANTYEFKFYCPTKNYYKSTNLKGGERINAVSPIGILTYNNRKIMFTGDSNEITEPLVMARTGKIDCDVLKVGHHGSETSTMGDFLDEYTFEYALISCRYNTSYYHPRQETLNRLKNRNIAVYRTDNNGNIVLTIDKNGNLKFDMQTECSQETNYIGYVYGQKKTNVNAQASVAKQNMACLFFNTRIAA